MKRNIIVEKLIKEGMSENTLVKLNDKQLSELAERMLGETITTTMAAIQKSPSLQAAAKDKAQTLNVVGEEDMTEDLKGNQKKIDKNHNGKIDAQDFKMMKTKKCEHCGKELSKCSCDDSHLGESKPLAGLSKEKKSAVVKKTGKKAPAAAMWKNVQKENIETKKWVEGITENELFHSLTSKNEIMDLIKTKLNESKTSIVNEEYMNINDIKNVINGTFRKK
jgi:hypothetical protein